MEFFERKNYEIFERMIYRNLALGRELSVKTEIEKCYL